MTEPMGERGRQGAAPLGGHTPGPWTWDEQDGYVDGPPGMGTLAYDVGWDADGRLMASAPDLLALIEKWLETGIDREEAFAAIAKARGEQ